MTDGRHDPLSHGSIAGLIPGPVASSLTGRTHLLWDNGNGTAAVWRLDPYGSGSLGETVRRQFGPFAGWAGRALAVGADGRAYLLWAGRDQAASLWSVDLADGDARHARHWEFGPYDGWEARALAVGPDDVLRVLWAGAGGRAALWNLREESLREGEAPEILDCGPFAGWTAVSLSVGLDNRAHLLWTREDGAASVWLVGADGLAHQTEYGPYDGWRAAAAAGRDGSSRLLWRGAGGLASLWDLPAGDDDPTPDGCPQTVHGPFEGWTPAAVAQGADDAAHILWRYDGGGLASVWRMAGTGGNETGGVEHTEYGPYAGWVPIALALGP